MSRGTKLSKDEPTVTIEFRAPLSVKQWLAAKPGGISDTIRRLVAAEKRREARRVP